MGLVNYGLGAAGIGTIPDDTLPADLPAALVIKLKAAGPLAIITEFYETQAGDRAVPPYVVYSIKAAPLYFTSSDSQWFDRRITINCYAATQVQANDLRDKAHDSVKEGSHPFQGGYSIPFTEVNRSEGKERGYHRGSTYVF